LRMVVQVKHPVLPVAADSAPMGQCRTCPMTRLTMAPALETSDRVAGQLY
jgi:hypothetical protein